MISVRQKDDFLRFLNFGNEVGRVKLGAGGIYHIDPFWWLVVKEWVLDNVGI